MKHATRDDLLKAKRNLRFAEEFDKAKEEDERQRKILSSKLHQKYVNRPSEERQVEFERLRKSKYTTPPKVTKGRSK